MRCGGSSPEDGDQTHIGTTRREKGVNSAGYCTGCLKKVIYCQGQSKTFIRCQREVSCMLGDRNLGRVQMYGGGKYCKFYIAR